MDKLPTEVCSKIRIFLSLRSFPFQGPGSLISFEKRDFHFSVALENIAVSTSKGSSQQSSNLPSLGGYNFRVSHA